MLPEIHTKKGENLMRLGRTALAIAELERAIQLKPDYWPPYAYISDYYKKKGDTAKAREWLGKALAFAPDAKGLRDTNGRATERRAETRPLGAEDGRASRIAIEATQPATFAAVAACGASPRSSPGGS